MTTATAIAQFPVITPQVTTLLMSEEEILESIENEDLYTGEELHEYLLSLDVDFHNEPEEEYDYFTEEQLEESREYYKKLIKNHPHNTPDPDAQLRSLQTCRHAYHLHKIDLFDMEDWFNETECGTSMCIAGSAATLYSCSAKDNYGVRYVVDLNIIGICWKPIFQQNNEVGLAAIKFVLEKAVERGFIKMND